MASPLLNAGAHPDYAPENATTRKPAATSRIPKQATVEDYFSIDEVTHENQEQAAMTTAPVQKPIIRTSPLPKRATVSWSDAPTYGTSQEQSSFQTNASRTSRLSEARTAVPSSPEYDRLPDERRKARATVASSADRVRRDRSAESRERRRQKRNTDLPISWDSEESDEWDRKDREIARSNRRRPSPDYYMGHTTREDRANNRSDGYRRHHMVSGYPGYGSAYPSGGPYPFASGTAQTPYGPWPTLADLYPYPRPTLCEASPFSQTSGGTLIGGPASQELYEYDSPPPWGYGRYHSFNLPAPPPPLSSNPTDIARQPRRKVRKEAESLSLEQSKEVAESTLNLAASEKDSPEEYKDLMHDLEQALEKYKKTLTSAKGKALVETDLHSHLQTLSKNGTQTSEHISDLDLLKLMEKQVQAMKLRNEEKLIEANEVLSYLSRGSEEHQQDSDDEIAPVDIQQTNVEVPNVHMFRTPEDETDFDDDSDDYSEGTDQDSIAGNSSGSSTSFPDQEINRIDRPKHNSLVAGEGHTESEPVELNNDRSSSSDTSHVESTLSEGEPPLSTPQTAGARLSNGLRQALTQPVPEAPAEHAMLDELVILRRDLSILKKNMARRDASWTENILSSAVARWKRHLRQPPRHGTQRLEWICECGDEMYADLPVENGTQYQQMLEFLTRPGPETQQASHNQTTPSQLEGGTARLDYTSLQSSQSSIGQRTYPASTIGSGSTYVGSDSSQVPAAQQNNPLMRNKYLELCVNVGKYETKLEEIQVSSSQSIGAAICTDAHLFRQIYHRYFALRKHTWRRFLYRPAGIKFVHFGVQAGNRVSFFSKDPLPSEDEIAAKRYEYNLKPPVPPPMDSRTFLHYFYGHNAYAHSMDAKYVDRLPKKLGDSLTRTLGVDDLLEGWGIHIIEGPNKVAICWALMVVLVASLGASIGYDLITRSGDSGFAIGQWMVAALTVALSALYFSLEDDVNTSFD